MKIFIQGKYGQRYATLLRFSKSYVFIVFFVLKNYLYSVAIRMKIIMWKKIK